ncbi:MAG: hypothetical protein V1928_05535 [Parcubacteria group bacterium]
MSAEKISNEPVSLKAQIVFSPQEDYKVGFGERKEGAVKNGYSFFELFKTEKGIKESYITSQVGDSPVLTAVTKKQFNLWKNKNIIARPVKFFYSTEKNTWEIIRG